MDNTNKIIIGSEGMGYHFSKYFIEYIIDLSFPNIDISHNNTNDSNLIIYTHFTNAEMEWNKQKKPYILWNGEKYRLRQSNKYRSKELIFSSLKYDNGMKIPYAFHAYIEYVKRNIWLKHKNLNPIINRKKLFGYCISANRGDNPRKSFIEEFVKYSSNTYALGRYHHEKSFNEKVNGKWMDENLQKKYSEFKFILAAENAQIDGYITEKIINVFSSGAIPIYIGDYNYSKKIFNHKAFICVNDFNSYEDCIKYIINLTDEELTNYFNVPIFTNEKESEIFREVNNRDSSENNIIINNIKLLLRNDI